MKSFFVGLSVAVIATIVLSLPSCSDNSSQDMDLDAPTLQIDSPTENSSFTGSVSITGHVTDQSLHAMSITVTGDSDGAPLFTAHPSIHAKTDYFFDETWTPSVSAETAVTLTISVEDHSNHTTTSTVHFTVKP